MEICRKDTEYFSGFTINGVEKKDWDDILNDIKINPILICLKNLRRLEKYTGINLFLKIRDWFQFSFMEPILLKKVSQFFLKYDRIYTTRLHGYILATMLHLPVEWVDTKFGKRSPYINTWYS